MWRVMERMVEGRAQKREIDMLLEVTKQIEGHTICALGDAAAWPIQGLIRHFRHVIEARIDAYTYRRQRRRRAVDRGGVIMHIAELNIGRLNYPIDDPRMADFVDNLGRVNAMAERMPGFVWRLVGDGSNDGALELRPYADPMMAVNMSVWETVEHLEVFVWKTVHQRFYNRKAEWFEPMKSHHFVMWFGRRQTHPDARGSQGAARSSRGPRQFRPRLRLGASRAHQALAKVP